jgi:hypothetical protein
MSESTRTGATGWFGRAAALALGGLVLAAAPGCLENPLGSSTYAQATATNDKTYAGTGTNNADFSDAVQASGAHDIPCPITQVTAHWVKEHEWVAEGCGQRIDYIAKHKFAVPWKISLQSRAKLPAGSAPLPATAPPSSVAPAVSPTSPGVGAGGCSKDVDCKGERICVNAMCVDPPPKPVSY